MDKLGRNLIEVEIHQLEMPLMRSRLKNRKAQLKLIHSLEVHGQIRPVLAIKKEEKLFLLDGHLRVEALRKCGKDTVWVELVACDLANGLLMLLARNQSRQWEPLEEAELIRQLIDDHGMSGVEVARAVGKDPSWVSRRLTLLMDLPIPVLEAVKKGQIGQWAAIRVLAPLARANQDHALSLIKALDEASLSSRDLKFFFNYYKRSSKKVRERMIADPHLFMKASGFKEKEAKAKKVAAGPEGLLCAELEVLEKTLRDLRMKTDALAAAGALTGQKDLLEVFDRVDSQWNQLKTSVDRSRNDSRTNENRDCGDARSGNVYTGDLSEV